MTTLFSFLLSPPSSRRPAHGGFTLIEVIISIALGAVILAAVYTSFFMAEEATRVVGKSARYAFQSRLILDRLARELESSFYLRDDDSIQFIMEDQESFGRSTASISFATLESPLGVRVVSYKLKDDQLFRMEIDPLDKRERTYYEEPWLVLIADVQEFTIEAFHSGLWIRTWDSTLIESIPTVLRISLTFGDDDNLETVQQVARPKIGNIL